MNWSKLNKRVILAAGIVLLLCAGQLWSLTISKASLEELSVESALIIVGEINSIEYVWEDANQNAINTQLTIDVSRYLKGSGESQIVVTQLGGFIGDLGDVIPGTPRFEEGDEVILFLLENNGKYWIHSIALGCFRVFEGEAGEKVVINDLRNINLINPTTGEKVKPEDAITYFPMDDFFDKIESYLGK